MKRNIGDSVSGRLRNVVFYQRYGKTYVRMAPVTTPETWNDEQRMRRQRMSRVSALWRALRSKEFSAVWNTAAQQMNGYAWFVKANMPAFEMDGTLIDARMIKVADGKLPVAQMLNAERSAENASLIRVSWQNDPHTRGERLNDEMMVVSFNGEHFSPVTSTGLKRSQAEGSFTLPAKPEAAEYIYLFFAAEDKKGFSESRGFKI
jgi:hypothetical protein